MWRRIWILRVLAGVLCFGSAVLGGPQVLEVSPRYLEFTGYEGGDPNAQILSIWNSGHGLMDWTVTADCNWLTVEPNSGTSSGEVDDANIIVDINGLAVGTYNCQLTVTGSGAPNSPQTVTVSLEMLPIMLNYDTEAYAYAYAQALGSGDSDTRQGFSNNSKVQVHATASASDAQWCGPQDRLYWRMQDSDILVSAEGIYDSNGARLVSTLDGWGAWSWYDECSSTSDSGTGGGDGDGNTSLIGTMGIGVFEGYPAGTPGLALKIDAEIYGDTPSSWASWDWWFKIWDDDANNPLAQLNDSNISSTLEVLAGETLNIEVYHEAGKVYWPEGGLESTLMIDLHILPFADLDNDGDVDFVDFDILASQWEDVPGTPSADVAPPGGDGMVDGVDLGFLVKYWLAGL